MIIFILVAFLLSTALTSIMYLWGSKDGAVSTGENLTGIIETTGVADTTGTVDTAANTGTLATGETVAQ